MQDEDSQDEDSEEESEAEDQKRDVTGQQLEQVETTATLQEDLTPEKILQAYPNFRGEGRMLYKVRYRDSSNNKSQTTYTYDTKLPEDMRKDFHIKYTYSGKVRKRPPVKQ